MLILVARLAPLDPTLDPTALAALIFELNGQPWNLTVPIMTAKLDPALDTMMSETLELATVREWIQQACHESIMCVDSPKRMGGSVVRELIPSLTWSKLRENIERDLFAGMKTMLPKAKCPKPWHVPAMLLDLGSEATEAPPCSLKLVELEIIEVNRSRPKVAA
jgi:hypothetical protein